MVTLDSTSSGFDQITETLSSYDDLDAIHIITHGREGAIALGSDWLNNDNLLTEQDAISGWGDALNETGDILFYGCNIAASSDGQSLLDNIATLTEGDVAASNDLTGSAGLGGDWDLEVHIGEVEAVVAPSQAAQQSWGGLLDITNGLVGHWTFDADATDLSGNGYNGTLTNGALIDTTSGTNKIGGGKLSLDGSNDYVDLSSHVANFQNLSEGTIAVWINAAAASRDVIFEMSDSGDSDSRLALLRDSDGSLDFYIREGNTTLLDAYTGANAIPLDTWTHIAVTVDSSGNKLYVNGVQQGSLTYDAGSSTTDLFLDDVADLDFASWGVDKYDGASFVRYFDGLLDDGRLYDRALSASDISELYANAFHAVTVTTSADVVDGDTSSIAALSADAGTDGRISLREAMLAAENTTNLDGSTPDKITFNISNGDSNYQALSNSYLIQLSSTLPYIGDSVIIDATTQTGYDGTPSIDLDGSMIGGGSDYGFISNHDNVTIRGFVIRNFSGAGIYLNGSGEHTIQSNYIGTDVTGTLAQGNGMGIYLGSGADNVTIGGSGFGNLISGNLDEGIYLHNVGSTTVVGNLIGTDTAGTADLGNASYGIQLNNSSNNLIGGTATAERNVISGNNSDGITIWGSGSTGNVIQGNYIGVDVTGDAALGNLADGIVMGGGANNNTIGGDRTAGEGNVISGQIGANSDGIEIDNLGADNNKIYGNYIGTNHDGTAAIGNSRHGVVIYDGVQGTEVGGAGTGQGNIISGNTGSGIVIDGNGKITTTGNVIEGNYIGVDVTGISALGNSNQGVEIFGSASGNLIGGESVGAATSSRLIVKMESIW